MQPTYIFDLDGTLVDTAPDLLSATNAVLQQAGRPAIEPSGLREMVGMGARALILKAFAATGPALAEADLPPHFEYFLSYYRANIAAKSRPFPGVEETLKTLHGRARLAVLTNKPQDLADLLLHQLKLERYFHAIHGMGRLSVAKPDPRVFHQVVDELGGTEGGVIMIGDSATDVATARAAGAPVILVDYGYTPTPAHELGADAVISDFRRVPAVAASLLG